MRDTSVLEPAEYLMRLFDDVEFSYLVVVAAELGIADLLASGPRSIRSPRKTRCVVPENPVLSCSIASSS